VSGTDDRTSAGTLKRIGDVLERLGLPTQQRPLRPALPTERSALHFRKDAPLSLAGYVAHEVGFGQNAGEPFVLDDWHDIAGS
jgi:hypothetical protein